MKRPWRVGSTPLLVGAVVAALVATLLLRDSPGFVVRTDDGGYEGDITSYVYWTRLVALGGIQAAYSGSWPETYAVYPPVTLYGFQVVGTLYRVAVDPSFDLQRALASSWLPRGFKGAAVTWHLASALALFLLLRRMTTARRASWSAALYVANPAALYDAAHWAQPDGAHGLFSMLAVGWLSLGLPLLGWAAMALAALAKPQAWAILPLLALASWRVGRLRGLAAGAAVAVATSLAVVVPFLLTGRLADLLSLPGTIANVMPVATADAHNVWWLTLAARGLDPLTTLDSARLVGPVTYRTAAAALVLAQFALTYWLFWSRRATLAEAAALGALGWFVFTTEAHENHLFLALPLLALAWPSRPGLLAAYAVLSGTLLLNMVLHDQLVLEALGVGLADPFVQWLRGANALANVVCFAAWSVAAARGRVVSCQLSAVSAHEGVWPAAPEPDTAVRFTADS